jgi:PKD repeat protein
MRLYLRNFLLLFLFFSVFAVHAFAQTITVTNFDPGPYSPGSSIAVPFHVDSSTGSCISQTNTYNLYLSDPTGTSYSSTPLATVSGFYATYINATIPTTTVAGTNYKVKITATSSPTATIVESPAFTIVAGTAITAGITSSLGIDNAVPHEVFGNCNGSITTFGFQANAINATSVSASFVNESSQSTEATVSPAGSVNGVGGNGTFSPGLTSYTIVVKAGDGAVVGTKAYTLINNPSNSNFGFSGTPSVCQGGQLVFNIDIASPNGIQFNYPGNTYKFDWGDGSTTTLTLCDIVKLNGQVGHIYLKSSCGNIVGTVHNVFKISFEPNNPYCGSFNAVSTTAKISAQPFNVISGPGSVSPNTTASACTGVPVTFFNSSYPGEDPSSTPDHCVDFIGASYTWYLDGVAALSGVPRGTAYQPTLTAGLHTITLRLDNNPTSCSISDGTYKICVQDSPTPSFTLPASICISGGSATIIPTNTFAVDNSCHINPYKWTVSGGSVAYAGGTSDVSINPKFVFSTSGVYTIDLAVTDACGTIKNAPQQTMYVNTSPVVTLSADVAYCGAQTLSFNSTSGLTQTIYTGTSDEAAPGATYQWTVTGAPGATAATFVGGTSASSQYPRIKFPGFGLYTVTIVHTNSCGTSTATQHINIQNAPEISAGTSPDNTACAIDQKFVLSGAITDPANTVQSYKWTTSGDGTFDHPTTSLTPTYTFGVNDLNGATIQLTLTATTNLIGQCSNIPTSVNLTIVPVNTITNTNKTPSICTNTALNYALTASQPASTFTWTVSGSPSISGYHAQSTPVADPAIINDILVNSDPANSATITYTITPYVNGCAGQPSDIVVKVIPGPVMTPIPNYAICSGYLANVPLNSTNGVAYAWSATASAGITGFSNSTGGPVVVSFINDKLENSLTTPGTVTYQITPISAAGCYGSTITTTVTVQPPASIANAGADDVLCNQATYTLNGNTATAGTGKWTLTSGQVGVIFADNTNPQTTVSGLTGGQVYNFRWTITDNCNHTTTDNVQITVNKATVGGTAITAANPVCYGSNGAVSISGNVGNITGWEQSIDNGLTWQSIASATTTLNYTAITQTTSFRAIVQNNNCSVATSAPVTITVSPPTTIPDAGADQTLCTQTNTTLHGNTPTGSTGKWTQTFGPTAGVVITSPNSPTTTVTGLNGGNTYTFTWTIKGATPCNDLADNVDIMDAAPITNIIKINSASPLVCKGNPVTFTGNAPTGGTPPYTYIWEISTDNGLTWTTVDDEAGQNAIISLTVETQIRRTVFSDQLACSQVSNVLDIDVQTNISNNSVASTSGVICNNTSPGAIIGSIPEGGDGTYTFQWQQSTDNTTFVNITGATAKDYQPGALTTTTYFRRVVSSNNCGGTITDPSNVLTVKVNPDVTASYTATLQVDCAPFNITSQIIKAFNDPNAKTYTWYANGVVIGQGLAFPGYTIPNPAQTVTIKLVVTNISGCTDATFSLNFATKPQVIMGFTMDKTTGCGPVTVTFTNTSTPIAGNTFTWIFGDNTSYTGVTPPPHTFQPLTSGQDITYTVSLTTSTGCSPAPAAQQVTVYPAVPVAIIDPGTLSGCAPYSIKATNLSPGTNIGYTYYLLDENGVQVQKIDKTDKTSVQFNPVSVSNTKIYTLYMVAKNLCGVTGESIRYPITISAANTIALMSVSPLNTVGVAAACAPFQTVFHNLSTGGNSYVYNIYDSNFAPITSIPNTTTNDQTYTFTTAGTYYVSIGVFSNCTAGKESPKTKITVYPIPAPDFTASPTSNCIQAIVNFTNTTPGNASAPAVAYTYDWDFGDGNHSSQFSPSHTFDYKGSPYTVTLTATNPNGCTAPVVKTALIEVYPPPGTDFAAKPDSIIAIPNYHFDFVDKSAVKPVSWQWDFGDGTLSTSQNPGHTYLDTGAYRVTLTTVTAHGCTDSKMHLVQVTGVPGQLYVPNAFIPTSLTEELRSFTVKGSGIKQWTMRVFNNWGQVVFQTTKLSSKGEPVEFWDGKFKGQDAQQGVYAWEITATFINGTEWKGMSYKTGTPKKAGTLNLIR